MDFIDLILDNGLILMGIFFIVTGIVATSKNNRKL